MGRRRSSARQVSASAPLRLAGSSSATCRWATGAAIWPPAAATGGGRRELGRAVGRLVKCVARRLSFEAPCLPPGDGGAVDAAPPRRLQPTAIGTRRAAPGLAAAVIVLLENSRVAAAATWPKLVPRLAGGHARRDANPGGRSQARHTHPARR